MVPDTTVNVREMFGIDQDLEVPAFSERTDYVPPVDEDYLFDHDTTMAAKSLDMTDNHVFCRLTHSPTILVDAGFECHAVITCVDLAIFNQRVLR